MARGCKICHALTLELDSTGRCPSCAAVLEAQTRKVSYGNLIALKRRQEPVTAIAETVELEYFEEPAARPCACCGKEFPEEMDIRQIACPGECTRLYRKKKTIERLAAKERERGNG